MTTNHQPLTPVALSRSNNVRGKRLNIALWIAQGLLALAFVAAGIHKLTTPVLEFARQLELARPPGFSDGLFKFIGLVELLGGIGVVLPWMTRIKPKLTVLAALGLLTVMVLAFGYHVLRDELDRTAGQLVLGGLAAFVIWGRLRKEPIEPRT